MKCCPALQSTGHRMLRIWVPSAHAPVPVTLTLGSTQPARHAPSR